MILSSLREQFFALPEPLRRVLVFRLLSVLVSATLCLVCCFFAPGIQLAIPPFIFMVYCLFTASGLFSDCKNGKFICLRGNCSATEKTLFRRHTATIYISLEDRIIMVRPTFPIPTVQVGDTVAIYLSRHFPVYERDGLQVILRYYALSVTPGFVGCGRAKCVI